MNSGTSGFCLATGRAAHNLQENVVSVISRKNASSDWYSVIGMSRSSILSNVSTVGDFFVRKKYQPKEIFNTSIDTHVSDVLVHFWGSYCALILDNSKSTIAILPDPAGSWPVFFCKTKDGVVVSDSVDVLIGASCLEKSPNFAFLLDIGSQLAGFGPHTPLKDIFRIPPGHCLVIDQKGQVRLKRCWPMSCQIETNSMRDMAAELLDILQDVCRNIYSDNTAILLSGGRDSSLVAAVCARLNRSKKPTFIHYSNSGNKSEDEEYLARSVASEFGGNFISIDNQTFIGSYSLLHSERRKLSNYSASTFDKLIKQRSGCDSFINGEGGDAVFVEASYPEFYSVGSIAKMLDHCPGAHIGHVLRLVSSKLFPTYVLKSHPNESMDHFMLRGILTDEIKSLNFASTNLTKYVETGRSLMQDHAKTNAFYILSVMVDSVATATDYFGRNRSKLPLLSQPVLEFLFRQNLEIMLGEGRRALQREALKQVGLHMISNRSHKTGITSMVLRHFSDHTKVLKNLLQEGFLARRRLIDLNKMNTTFDEFSAGINDGRLRHVSGLVSLELCFHQLGMTC